MTGHARLAPSSAARRMACPGSLSLEEKYRTEDQSDAARQGTLAHEIARYMLENGVDFDFDKYAMATGTLLRAVASDMIQEMIDGAKLYCEHVLLTAQLAELHIEEKIEIAVVHADCWGTPDCWAFRPWSNELHVWDYKFGFSPVEVFENWQLLEYACGIIDRLNIQPRAISLHIVQPRGYHRQGPIRTWTISKEQLGKYLVELWKAERKAVEPDAPCVPSIQCTHCTARHACNALQRAALRFVDTGAETVPLELDAGQTGNELRLLHNAAKLLDARITGLEEQAKAFIAQGRTVPHYRMDWGQGREIWKCPVSQVITLGDMMHVDLRKPAEAITPKQAVKAGVPREVIDRFSETTRGALKLITDDGNQARTIFGNG